MPPHRRKNCTGEARSAREAATGERERERERTQTEPRANQVLWPVAFPITLRLGSPGVRTSRLCPSPPSDPTYTDWRRCHHHHHHHHHRPPTNNIFHTQRVLASDSLTLRTFRGFTYFFPSPRHHQVSIASSACPSCCWIFIVTLCVCSSWRRRREKSTCPARDPSCAAAAAAAAALGCSPLSANPGKFHSAHSRTNRGSREQRRRERARARQRRRVFPFARFYFFSRFSHPLPRFIFVWSFCRRGRKINKIISVQWLVGAVRHRHGQLWCARSWDFGARGCR